MSWAMISPGVLNWRACFFQSAVFIGDHTSICNWVQLASQRSPLGAISTISGTSFQFRRTDWTVRFQHMKEGHRHAPCGEHLLGLELGEHGITLGGVQLPMLLDQSTFRNTSNQRRVTGWVASSAEPLRASAWTFLNFLMLRQFSANKAWAASWSSEYGDIHWIGFQPDLQRKRGPILRLFCARRWLGCGSSTSWGRRLEG